ncbi:zinc ribbon domain-containing protein [Kluyvera sp. EC_51]|uniref:zinc ribbon domain-containing protein n=1 Tax=Kluyvera sp. EC_51 TaxID=2584089 RepID=UPI001C701E90|nr:zinc ribbon domain-containing protein [Kluyvera sp. EC_51]MBW9459998.1 zinc ribbon domain-containing protein [Kluyvera sp. EC_51]
MEFICPTCQASLEVQGNQAHCDRCKQDFTLEARCPECLKPLEVLKACGAVDYFCQNGHGLISKKRVEWAPVGE